MKRALIAVAISLTATLAVGENLFDVPLVDEEGQIHQIDYARNTAIISGITYRFAIDADIEVAGGPGAMTMLKPGMKVEFVYRRHGPSDLEIETLTQLSDSYPILEH